MTTPTDSRPMSTAAYRDLAERYLVPTTVGDVVIVRGEGAYVMDADGRSYLDCVSGPGVMGMGHGHPAVRDAIVAQLERIVQAPGGLVSAEAVALAERLAILLPATLQRSYFVNSGAEAVELSIKLAVKYQRQRGRSGLGLIALRHGFHGRSALALTLTGLGPMKRGLASYAAFPQVSHIATPYCYRCPLRPASGCCDRAIHELEDTIRHGPAGDFTALIVEPIPGVGGVIVPPDGFLPQVERICRREGILLVVDEIFTGFGRTGRLFGHQHWDVSPDVMAIGKYLGGGLPLAASVTTDDVAAAFTPADHYTTFGGNNALACAAGLAAMTVLVAEDLASNAARVGARILDGLRHASESSAIVGDVRGVGLLLAVELVSDRESKAPGDELAAALRAALMARGILVGITGEYRNIVRITPPLTIDDAQADHIVDAIASSVRDLERGSRLQPNV